MILVAVIWSRWILKVFFSSFFSAMESILTEQARRWEEYHLQTLNDLLKAIMQALLHTGTSPQKISKWACTKFLRICYSRTFFIGIWQMPELLRDIKFSENYESLIQNTRNYENYGVSVQLEFHFGIFLNGYPSVYLQENILPLRFYANLY